MRDEKYFRFGFWVSAAYCCMVVVWIIFFKKYPSGLELNELGDFLAGVFSPLAFLWLVLGFLQQGEELKQNGEALRLQADELRNSVEQQRELVGAAREQIEIDKGVIAAQADQASRRERPKLFLSGGGNTSNGGGRLYMFKMQNIGELCSEIEISIEGPSVTNSGTNKPLLERGDSMDVNISTNDNSTSGEIILSISCNDMNGVNRIYRFKLKKEGARILGAPQAAEEVLQGS